MANVDTPLVMIWRQVPDLASAKTFTESMLNVKAIGQDDDSLMYDAGSVILGLFGQAEFAQSEAVTKHNLAMEAAPGCSALNFSRVNLVVNPAANLSFATDNLHMPRARLREEGISPQAPTTTGQLGETLPFYDDAGNLFSMIRFSEQAKTSATGFVGAKLASIFNEGRPEQHLFAGLNLTVSDPSRSAAFYTDVLGFRRLEGLDKTISFDVGTSVMHLVQETTPRMVWTLQKSGRLLGDWFVFHTNNIEEKVSRLRRLGVQFPNGIEDSDTGRMAYFNDPDGYTLVIWQPPTDESLPTRKIKFFPVLNRILYSASAT